MKTRPQLHKQYEQHSREVTNRGHVLIDLAIKSKSVDELALIELAHRKLMRMTKADLIKALASDLDLVILGCSFQSEAKANKE